MQRGKGKNFFGRSSRCQGLPDLLSQPAEILAFPWANANYPAYTLRGALFVPNFKVLESKPREGAATVNTPGIRGESRANASPTDFCDRQTNPGVLIQVCHNSTALRPRLVVLSISYFLNKTQYFLALRYALPRPMGALTVHSLPIPGPNHCSDPTDPHPQSQNPSQP